MMPRQPLRPCSDRIALAAAAGAAALLAGAPAAAAEARLFRLPAEPLERALLRFAVQGGVSVGGLPAPGCSGLVHPVQGLLSPGEALSRLLPAGCGFEQVDPRSFRVVGHAAAPIAPVHAAPPAEPPSAVDQLIVTAERRPEPLLGSPYPVTALPGSDVTRLGGATFETLAPQMVGVVVTNLGPGRDKIFVRSLSDGPFTGRTQSMVGLYLDDAPVTYNAPDPDLRLIDIDRVEVLRGPQGTLYGSGSMGGIVHIVTRAPQPGVFEGELQAGAAITEKGEASSRLGAIVNVPLAGDWAARAVAYSDDSGGYLNDVRIARSDANESRRWGARLAIAGELPDAWRLRLTFAHQSTDNDDAQYTEGGSASLTREVQVLEPSDNDFSEAAISATHTFSGADLKISTAFVNHVLQDQYDATGAFPGAVPADAPTGFDDSRKITLGVVEASLTSAATGRLRWIVGGFVSEAREIDAGKLQVVGAPPKITIYRRRDRLQEGALYGEATYDLTSRLSVTAGLRWFATHRSTHADSFGIAARPLPPMDGELTDRGIAPKLRVSYAFAPDLVAYAQAQKGYRAGGFNIPAAAGGHGRVGTSLPRFLGDNLWSYEAGVTAPLFQRRLTLRVAAFHTDWRRLQTDQFLPSGLPMTVNVGDASDDGVEAEAVWRSGPHWQVRANVLLANPQIVELTQLFPARRAAGLPSVPDGMGSLDVRYSWRPWEGYRATLSAQAAYVGRSHVTFAAGSESLMGGYATGRLDAELDTGRWRLQAYIDNVTDTKGDTFAFGNPFSQSRALQVTPLRPLTAGFELAWDF